jgi:hypothetical protein
MFVFLYLITFEGLAISNNVLRIKEVAEGNLGEALQKPSRLSAVIWSCDLAIFMSIDSLTSS